MSGEQNKYCTSSKLEHSSGGFLLVVPHSITTNKPRRMTKGMIYASHVDGAPHVDYWIAIKKVYQLLQIPSWCNKQ